MGELVDYFAQENAVILMGVTANWGSTLTGAQALAHADNYFPTIEFVSGQPLPAANSAVPFSAVIDLETMEVLGKDVDSYDYLTPIDVYHLTQEANAD